MLVAFDLPRETSKSLDGYKIRLSPRRFDPFSRHLSSDSDQRRQREKNKKKEEKEA